MHYKYCNKCESNDCTCNIVWTTETDLVCDVTENSSTPISVIKYFNKGKYCKTELRDLTGQIYTLQGTLQVCSMQSATNLITQISTDPCNAIIIGEDTKLYAPSLSFDAGEGLIVNKVNDNGCTVVEIDLDLEKLSALLCPICANGSGGNGCNCEKPTGFAVTFDARGVPNGGANTRARLIWQKADNAVNYTVEYKNDNSATWINLTSTSATSASVVVAKPAIYDFRVKANCTTTDENCNSTWAYLTKEALACVQPTGGAIAAIGVNAPSLVTWTYPYSMVNGSTLSFILEYRPDNVNNWTIVNVPVINSPLYSDNWSADLTGINLPADVIYHLCIIVQCDPSNLSDHASGCVFDCMISDNFIPTISAITQTTATATWVAVTGAIGYKILIGNGSWINLGNVTSYNITGLTPNTPTVVRLAAVCGSSNESCPGKPISFTPLAFNLNAKVAYNSTGKSITAISGLTLQSDFPVLYGTIGKAVHGVLTNTVIDVAISNADIGDYVSLFVNNVFIQGVEITVPGSHEVSFDEYDMVSTDVVNIVFAKPNFIISSDADEADIPTISNPIIQPLAIKNVSGDSKYLGYFEANFSHSLDVTINAKNADYVDFNKNNILVSSLTLPRGLSPVYHMIFNPLIFTMSDVIKLEIGYG